MGKRKHKKLSRRDLKELDSFEKLINKVKEGKIVTEIQVVEKAEKPLTKQQVKHKANHYIGSKVNTSDKENGSVCRASKYLDGLKDILSNVDRDLSILSRKMSKYDIALTKMYHKIEVSKFNACEGFYLAKEIQQLVRERRIVKDEFMKLTSLKQSLSMGDKLTNCNKNLSRLLDNQRKYQVNFDISLKDIENDIFAS